MLFKQYLYVSLGEWQLKNEQKLTHDANQVCLPSILAIYC